MTWPTTISIGVLVIVGGFLWWVIRKASQRDQFKQAAEDLQSQAEKLANSIHDQEMREAIHAEEVQKIISGPDPDPRVLEQLLNSYPDPTK